MPFEVLPRLACCGVRSVFLRQPTGRGVSRRKLLPLNRLRTSSHASCRRPLAKLFSVSAPVSRVPAQLTAACSGGFGKATNATTVPKRGGPLLRWSVISCWSPEWGRSRGALGKVAFPRRRLECGSRQLLNSRPAMEQPAPEFSVGEPVRVVPNERCHTPRQGKVERVIWHHKDQQYNYYLSEAGKRISKRYLAADLQPDPGREAGG